MSNRKNHRRPDKPIKEKKKKFKSNKKTSNTGCSNGYYDKGIWNCLDDFCEYCGGINRDFKYPYE